jgi:ribonuclease R
VADVLAEQAKLSSKNELRAVKCERDVNAMKFAEYMQQHIGSEFDGFVTSVSPFGLFVQLENTVEGLIKLNNLKNDFYTYNDKTNELIGRKLGMRFSLGTKVRIKVISASKELRKIEFELVKLLTQRS